MASEVPDCGILLAEGWKLVPVDERNWELCEHRAPRDSHGNPRDGEPRWFRCGRFYQYNTIDEALLYVADEMAKRKCWTRQMELGIALVEYRVIANSIRATARALS